MTSTFSRYQGKDILLLPENGHLSRYGNRVIAKELTKHFSGEKHRAHFIFTSARPKIMGDLRPNEKGSWDIVEGLPFRVYTNAQGFRNTFNIDFPKTKQRVLVLGDSFTFGPYLPNHDTYPALLNKHFKDKEFINAGKPGYTIIQQSSLFLERAKYVEPDITLLQVLDNDLCDLFFFKLNQYKRTKKEYVPSDLETEFFNTLKKMKKKHSRLNLSVT
jgi:lysophospholipase L1-like esterase